MAKNKWLFAEECKCSGDLLRPASGGEDAGERTGALIIYTSLFAFLAFALNLDCQSLFSSGRLPPFSSHPP